MEKLVDRMHYSMAQVSRSLKIMRTGLVGQGFAACLLIIDAIITGNEHKSLFETWLVLWILTMVVFWYGNHRLKYWQNETDIAATAIKKQLEEDHDIIIESMEIELIVKKPGEK